MSFDDAWEAAAPIDGYVSEAEGRILYELALTADRPVVEVGSWKGRSTILLGHGARARGVKVYAVDPHAGSHEHDEKGEDSTLGEFVRNLRAAGVEGVVVPLVMTSREAREHVPCPIGLLFLDGPTEGREVMEEMDRWLPCLGEGAVLAVHDSVSMPGPREAAERMYLSSRFADVRLVESITCARVVVRASMREKLIDLERLLLKRTETLLGRFNYPEPVRRMGRRALDLFYR